MAADLTHAPMMDADAFLAELEPVTARLLDRHLAQAKEWFPHELVPYSRGRDFDRDYEWSPDSSRLALVVGDSNPAADPEKIEGWKRKTKPPSQPKISSRLPRLIQTSVPWSNSSPQQV